MSAARNTPRPFLVNVHGPADPLPRSIIFRESFKSPGTLRSQQRPSHFKPPLNGRSSIIPRELCTNPSLHCEANLSSHVTRTLSHWQGNSLPVCTSCLSINQCQHTHHSSKTLENVLLLACSACLMSCRKLMVNRCNALGSVLVQGVCIMNIFSFYNSCRG